MGAILGMAGTGDWASSSERPTNFREKILKLYPNSPAILTMISGKQKSEAVDDPRFTTFEQGLPPMRFLLTGDHNSSVTTINFNGTDSENGGLGTSPTNYLRAGMVAMVESTQEVVWVETIASGTTITVTRGDNVGSTSAAMATADHLLVIGNRNAEGADTPESVALTPTTQYNYTQIWRTPMKLTGTAKETYLRTGAIEPRLKLDAAERHAIEMEYSALFGVRHEDTTGSQYERTTGGFIDFMSKNDNPNYYDAGGALTKSGWELFLEGVFQVPSKTNEKLCVCGNRALTVLNQMAQAYGQIQLTPTSESYGMKFMRYETPYGTLQLKGHPLLSQNPGFSDWGFIIDPSNMVYRPLKNRDTKFLSDRQGNGEDAIVYEFLTEAGWEFRHAKTHGYFEGASAFTP